MQSFWAKARWMLAGVLALFVVSALAGVVSGGALDPPGAPGSTMLRLSDLPPAWHQLLASNDGGGNGCNSLRFQCVLNDTGVLDRETGLVWQRNVAPDATTLGTALISGCDTLELGGRYGWRLPVINEIRSLADTSPDHLPDGHPFVGVLTAAEDTFWTTSVFPAPSVGPLQALVFDADAPGQFLIKPEAESHRRWCVRGGSEFDVRL